MGRKSNTKKIVRKLVQEKEEKSLLEKKFFKKKSKKELKKELKKTPQKAAKKSSSKKITAVLKKHQKRIFAGVFTIIMVAILFSVAYLLFQKAFKAQPIAKYLPATHTIATLEINSNFDHHQLTKAFNLLRNQPEYSKEKLIEGIEKYFQINYKNDLSLWLGRSVGMAIISSENKEVLNTIYFAEFISRSNLDRFLAKYDLTNAPYKGYTTYAVNENRYLALIDDYLFITTDKLAMHQIIDAQTSGVSKLYNSPQYRKVDDNLPLNNVAFAYINFESVNDAVFKHFPFLSEKGVSVENLNPLLKVFKAEGISLIAMDDNFAVQSFLSLSDAISNDDDYLSFRDKYQADLLVYVPADALFFWGGENLDNQLKRLIKLLSGGDDASLIVLDTIIREYSKKYFGSDVDFKKDILPLISNEFNFVLENIDGKEAFKLIIKLNDSQSDAVKIHEIAGHFAEVGAIFEPKVVERELKDGTIAREIMAVPKEINKSELKYLDYTIFELNMGEENKGLYYAIVDDVAFATNNEKSLKRSLDLIAGTGENLRNTEIFKTEIEPVMKSSDEVSYFNLPALLPLFFNEQDLPKFISIISSLSSGRNYFNDGIVTINYLHIK